MQETDMKEKLQKIIEAYNNGEILEEGVETWNI